MAFSLALQRLSLIVAILVIATPHFTSAQDPLQIIGKAILCFDNQTVYNDCGRAIRSSINGTVNNTIVICSKPCLAEAFLILDCIDGILSNFPFFNNLTIPAVKATFRAACNNINITIATNTSEHRNHPQQVHVSDDPPPLPHHHLPIPFHSPVDALHFLGRLLQCVESIVMDRLIESSDLLPLLYELSSPPFTSP
ncbi:hypothetical protein QJS04_geneDACA007123 [Acorus gramineus]|uniref:DUF7731 domain-containing protein n=1 Tax=Acorus gramineus TaxID=55184 RepID=A0AAV9BSY5_ACOGR|nr:hypothetical protein QJS04_geneDACA007123 [Acorus gramineus]